VTLSDSKIFNDTEHRATSSRQLSFLLNVNINVNLYSNALSTVTTLWLPVPWIYAQKL